MGEFFALSAAVIWAFAVILFKKSGETVAPFSLNFFRVAISIPLFLVTLTVINQPLWAEAPRGDVLILVLSGVVGIAVADTLFHMSLNRVGAGITAIVDCLYSPLIVLLAFLLIRERLSFLDLAGMVLVVAGVLMASQLRPPAGTDQRTLVVGILLGALGMLALAFSVVIAKPVLNRSAVFWATAVRQVGSLLVMFPVTLHPRFRKEVWRAFRPGIAWKYTLTGSVLGSYLAVTVWIAGMKYTLAGTAAILNQTTTVFIILLANLFLKEPLSIRTAAAALMALAGILLVILA
jgi:drug/metabolite transporter (DMT)-like permease